MITAVRQLSGPAVSMLSWRYVSHDINVILQMLHKILSIQKYIDYKQEARELKAI